MDESTTKNSVDTSGSDLKPLAGKIVALLTILLIFLGCCIALALFLLLYEKEQGLFEVLHDNSSQVAVTFVFISLFWMWIVYTALRFIKLQSQQNMELAGFLDRVGAGDYEARSGIKTGPGSLIAGRIDRLVDSIVQVLKEREKRAIFEENSMRLLVDISSIRDGDLTVKADATEDTQGAIADSFNALTANFSQVVAKTKNHLEQLHKAAATLPTHFDQLIEVSLKQAKEATTSLEVLKACIKETKNNGDTENTPLAQDDALNNLLKSVDSLQNNFAKIEKSSEIMADFSDKTEILALNTSIQSSMMESDHPSEHNFGQISDEIRRLAGSSADSAKDIEVLLQDFQTDLEDIQDLAGKCLPHSQDLEKSNSDLADSNQHKRLVALLESVEKTGDICRKSALAGNEMAVIFESLLETAADLNKSIAHLKIVEPPLPEN